jgi:hypothetical protein
MYDSKGRYVMPFVPPSQTGLMVAKGVGSLMAGEKFTPFVNAASTAICQYLMMAPIVMTTNMVIGPGAGAYTGKIIGCVPSAMTSLMMIKAAGSMLVGRDTQKLFDAVSFGVCMTLLTTAISQGSVLGGGPGAGQGKIVNLVPSMLLPLIVAQLAGAVLIGEKTMQIIDAITFGICMHIMTAGTVVTTCIGAFAPPPVGPIPIPAAPGPGRLF